MTPSIVPYTHPKNGTVLMPIDGGLKDPESRTVFPIVRDIPRFCPTDNYSKSFGLQWNLYDRTQLDVHSGTDHSQQRFYAETGWNPGDLGRCRVLEVGSGAGRFSEVLLRTTTGLLHSVDYSNAVDANRRSNAAYGERLRLAQASIYELPFADNSFDKVFCLGVLQHTPSLTDSVAALIRKTRVEGEIVVDFYPINGWYTKIHAKYILRPLTKRIPKPLLLKLIRLNIGWMLRLFDVLCAFRLGALTRFIPITDVRGFPRTLSPDQRREWAVLDTFDAFSPAYDNPQRVEDVARMFINRGCRVTHAGYVRYPAGSSMLVRAVRQV